MVIEDPNPDPSIIRSQLREREDFDYARRLQDQEFGIHYDQNRTERRTVGSDTKQSRVVQQHEDETARALRRQQYRQIEETDEQIAQRLAAEWNAEEARLAEEKLRQELIDEEIARRLAESGEFAADVPGSSSAVPSSNPPTSTMPTQPPPYDFAVRDQQPQREDLLIDFNSAQSIPPPPPAPPAPPSSSSVQPSNNPPKRIGGVALPGLAPSPSADVPQSSRLISQQSLDNPVAWPPPPPSVLASNAQISSNNPFLADLASTNPVVASPSMAPSAIGFAHPVSVPPPSSQPPPIGFQSEFGLPPPSSLALGFSGVGSHPQ